MSHKLEEGTYKIENGLYKCVKCDYFTNFPCLMVSHQKRKTPCNKGENEKTFIFKKGNFKVIFN